MPVLHTLRALRFLARGRLDRARVDAASAAALVGTRCPTSGDNGGTAVSVDQQPDFMKTGFSCAADSTVTMYMGFRLADAFGHINNAKYLEMFEFGRWYEMTYTGLDKRAWHAGIYPVVRSVSIQYIKEIKPFQKVVIRTQFPMATVEDGRTAIIAQQIESTDGKTIFATGVVRASFLNLPVKAPTGTIGKSLKQTTKGPVPIAEVMNRLFAFKEEREASRKFKEASVDKSSSNSNVNKSDMFSPEFIVPLNTADEAWRGGIIKHIKLSNGASKKK